MRSPERKGEFPFVRAPMERSTPRSTSSSPTRKRLLPRAVHGIWKDRYPIKFRCASDAAEFGEIALAVRAGASANESGIGAESLWRAFGDWPACIIIALSRCFRTPFFSTSG